MPEVDCLDRVLQQLETTRDNSSRTDAFCHLMRINVVLFRLLRLLWLRHDKVSLLIHIDVAEAEW
jgi:hypothetical protein